MTKTRAEYQRDYRNRKKEQERSAGDQTEPHMKRPFCDFIDDIGRDELDAMEWMTVEEVSTYAGITYEWFERGEDRDFEYVKSSFAHGSPADFEEYMTGFGKIGTSLAKAERMKIVFEMGHLVMSRLINRYKTEEIEERIAELEASDFTDAAVRKAALADIVKLNKILDRLKKEVRLSFPVTEVKG